MIHTDDFRYELPDELIAQVPLQKRDACRLFVVDRKVDNRIHTTFSSIGSYLRAGDRLVFNNTRVIPARLFCIKSTGAQVEMLFTERITSDRWRAIVKPGRRVKSGAILQVISAPNCMLAVEDGDNKDDRTIVFHKASAGVSTIDELLEKHGEMPLPHYINRKVTLADSQQYQTVYASKLGAIAAPTAGLHFTPELLDSLKHMGITSSFVTLHVGVGTFRPVKVDNPREHDIHEERFEVDEVTATQIAQTRKAGGRIVAVGTTVVRVLEHCAAKHGSVVASSGRTKIFILPPYEFKVVDALITNFHLPRSTLLMLVSAFAGRERILSVYNEAVKEKYRFFSYGDAMLVS